MIDRAFLKKFMPSIALALGLVRFRVRMFLMRTPLHDFTFYWAGSRLFLAHAHPYSVASMAAIERSLGWKDAPVGLLYPPWVLPFFAGFGLFPFPLIHSMWRLAYVAIEAPCVLALWRYFGGSRKRSWIALAVLFTFLPAGSAEQMGQVTCLLLAGSTLFLYLVRDQRYGWAGACLLLLCLKPQLVLLVLLAILLWSVRERHWAVLAAGAAAVAASFGAAFAYNHNVLEYFHSTQPELGYECGIGGALRSSFGMQHAWLQFVPTVLGLAWFAVRWTRCRKNWDWSEQMPLLLLASLASAPYAWADDYVLALPALVALALRLYQRSEDFVMPAAIYFLLQVAVFSYLPSNAWETVASALWLAFYVFFTAQKRSGQQAVEAETRAQLVTVDA